MANGTISLGTSGNLQGQIVWSCGSDSYLNAYLQIRKGTSTTKTTGTFSYEFEAAGRSERTTWYGSIETEWVTIATINNAVGYGDNGSTYIYGKVTAPTGTTLEGLTVSGSEQVVLYATITQFEAISITDKSVTFKWETNIARDWSQYSLNGGEWTECHDTVASDNKSGTFTIDKLEEDTTYSVRLSVRKPDSYLWTTSAAISVTTLKSNLIKIKQNGTWKEATSYLKINGSWKEAKPYIKVNGVWEEGV